MKRSAFAGLFICAAMLASPVFAATDVPAKDNLCSIQLKEIEQKLLTSGQTSENTNENLKAAYEKAQAAHASGNDKECISLTTQELQRIQNINKGGEGK